MRRVLVALAGLSALLVAVGLVPATSENASADPARGLVFEGLQRDPGACSNAFRLVSSRGGVGCSHGPDAAPAGVDVRQRRHPDPIVSAAATAVVQCYGTGSDGFRVQLIYAHASNVADRFSQYQASFAQWAAAADGVFNASAAETGATRHVRFVTNSSCAPVVDDVTLSTSGDDNLNNTINELRAKGYTRTDRKYLVWVDANVYCGIAQVYNDDSAAQTNLSNGSTRVSGEFARVDNGCWGAAGQSVEAHELMHTLGGVQTTAPHATKYSHCWDESDRMCYADGSGSVMKQICPTSHENVFDCNHDDYFFAGSPPSGNYLATHWNVANSAFLAGTNGAAPAPPATSAPSAPRSLTATRPASGVGVKLAWQAPSSSGSSALTGYDVYRRTATGSYALVKRLTADHLTWRDQTTTSGTVYYYVVKAKNAAGSSASSNEASATAR